MLALIEEMNSMGVTIILIEHAMKVMMRAVHRIVVMDKGEKIAESRPADIMKDQRVIEAYFG